MAYTPTNWVTGDTVTATKMNKLEQGVANAGSALIVHYNFSDNALDKTYQEIYDAIIGGTPVYLSYIYGNPATYYQCIQRLVPITTIYKYDESLRIVATYTRLIGTASSYSYSFAPTTIVFSASNLNSYPTFYCTISSTTSNNAVLGDAFNG